MTWLRPVLPACNSTSSSSCTIVVRQSATPSPAQCTWRWHQRMRAMQAAPWACPHPIAHLLRQAQQHLGRPPSRPQTCSSNSTTTTTTTMHPMVGGTPRACTCFETPTAAYAQHLSSAPATGDTPRLCSTAWLWCTRPYSLWQLGSMHGCWRTCKTTHCWDRAWLHCARQGECVCGGRQEYIGLSWLD